MISPRHSIRTITRRIWRSSRTIRFEVRALRAYFHFELLRRYNRIVIGDRSFTMQEVNTLVPVSYDDAAGWIVSECDAVIPSLPKTYLGTENG